MRSNGVVPEQPVDHLQVEGRYIVSKQRSVEHNEVFRDRSVETLDEGVLLRRTDMGIEVREAEKDAGFLEVLGELASVVCLELVYLERTDLDNSPEEVSGTLG